MEQRLIKIVLIGDVEVGKTTIACKATEVVYKKIKTTIGTDFLTKKTTGGNTLQIWDTPGKEEYITRSTPFYSKSDAFVFVIDGTQPLDKEIPLHVKAQLIAAKEEAPDAKFYIAVNKIDQDVYQNLSYEENASIQINRSLRNSNLSEACLDALENAQIIFLSGQTGRNVDLLFGTIEKDAIEKLSESQEIFEEEILPVNEPPDALDSPLFKHVWNKVYFNNDLPKDRSDLCDLSMGKALFEFFVPTTKRKNSVSQWLGFYQSEYPDRQKEIKINSISDLNVKAIFLIIIDVLLYLPRLALNIVKLFTEVLPLTLRELAYAAFESMVKGADEAQGISKRLYQLAAGICWLFTSLFSFVYFAGCLLTSPGMTIISMMETMEQLEFPWWVEFPILGLSCLAVFAFYLAMIVILSPIILPISVVMTPAALVIEGSGWIGGAIEFALVLFCMSGLMFNNNPDDDSLLLKSKTTSLSIYPKEFLRIFDEKSYQAHIEVLKIKKLGDKATESQKAPYKERAEKDPMAFLKICQTNISLFSIEEQIRFFEEHDLGKRFATVQPQKLELVKIEEQDNFLAQPDVIKPVDSAQPQEIKLFEAVVGKILYRLCNAYQTGEDNIDSAITFVKLLPDWVFFSLETDFRNKDGSANFEHFVYSYAQAPSDKLGLLLKSSVCRANTTWITHYIAKQIWFALVDIFSSNKERQQTLERVLSFLSLLSDKDCSFLVKCDDLKRMYQSVDNAILILNTLPRLFAHCGTKLVSLYSDDERFIGFLKKNSEKLNLSKMVGKIITNEKLTDEKLTDKIKFTLTKLYPYFSEGDKEKISTKFPKTDFSKDVYGTSSHANYPSSSKRTRYHGDSTYHGYDKIFAPEFQHDKEIESQQRKLRIERAEQYANEGIDLYQAFEADSNASPGELKSAINKFYRVHAMDLNAKEASETLATLNGYKEILLCPHAHLAYDQSRAPSGFSLRKFF